MKKITRYSVDGIAERPDVKWWVPENDMDKVMEMLNLAMELISVPEHCQDQEWNEKYRLIFEYLK